MYTLALEHVSAYKGWANHILTVKARCLLELGDYEQALTLIANFPEDTTDIFSLDVVERNLMRIKCNWSIGNVEEAKKVFRDVEALMSGYLENSGLETHITILNELRDLIAQDWNKSASN